MVVAAALALVVALAAGCGDDAPEGRPGGTDGSGPSGSVTVAAAASLTEAFEELAAVFEEANPDASVELDLGASSALATRILQGAPVDVFASADEANMQKVSTAGLVDGTPRVFARNALEIATRPGNPERVRGLADLPRVDVVALCGKEVPCGRSADQALARAGVVIPESRVTRGQDVKATLGAVSEGDADAAVVYTTDVRAAGRAVTGVEIPEAQNVPAVYPIAVLRDAGRPEVAAAFVGLVTSPRGREVLASFGFRAP